MGGQWIPRSFVEAHILWDHLAKFVDPDGFFGVVAITRDGPDKLILHDREGNKTTQSDDRLIEVFLALKNAGNDSAIVVHRGFHQCWMTSWTDAEYYLKNENDQQDEDYRV